MYQHHKESIENLKNYFADREEVIAVIFGGSVAKGCERPDSDLDAMVVITEEEYEIRQRGNRTAETIEGLESGKKENRAIGNGCSFVLLESSTSAEQESVLLILGSIGFS